MLRGEPRGQPALTIISVVVVLFAIYVAKPVLVPICFAWLLKMALTPIVRRLGRVGIPVGVGAALVLLSLSAAGAFTVYKLANPTLKWVTALPEELPSIEAKLAGLREPLDRVTEATDKVEKMATAEPEREAPVKVDVAGHETLFSRLFAGAWLRAVSAFMTLVLLYFMLATDEVLLAKIVEATPRPRDKKAVVAVVRAVEMDVGRYLLTIGVTNLLLGGVVGLVMAVLGMPNPALWGVLACLLNFVPYVGGFVGITVIAAVALLSFDTIGAILAPPLAYLGINAVEGLLITPSVLGRRMAISPVALFVWLLLLSWLWGVAGALLAVPLLVVLKIVSDHVPPLAPLSTVIGSAPRRPVG
jgi:predicted PurR-regulated permease PerM